MSSSKTAAGQPAKGTEATQEEHLNDIITRFRPLDMNEIQYSKLQLGRMKWTLSSIAEHYLRCQFTRLADTQNAHDGNGKTPGSVPSLASMSAAKINQMLSVSDYLRADVVSVSQTLNSTTLRQLLRDERTPYKVLRAFLDPAIHSNLPSWAVSICRSQDVDEAVLRQNKHIQSLSPGHDKHDAYLVNLEDLANIVGNPLGGTFSTITFERKSPPLGGFELFDGNRERIFDIIADHKTYSDVFHQATDNVLKELDWANVMVAGDLALATLMRGGDSKPTLDLRDFSINVYLYGLDPKAANKKVEEIYELWRRNLPADGDAVVIKNAKLLVFFADYPYPRLQIVLKHFPSPTDVLQSFDLDQCALGFDGNRLLMLPRCARAIETGYSVLTMPLIHLSETWPVKLETRLWQWADRGFGVRILPAYAKSLEEDPCAADFGKIWNQNLGESDTEIDFQATHNVTDGSSTPGADLPSFPRPSDEYVCRDSYRMPDGPEPGIKTLKRVAYLGQDFPNRYCFGNTPLDSPSGRHVVSRTDWIVEYEERKRFTQERTVKRSLHHQSLKNFNRTLFAGLSSQPEYHPPNDLPDGMPHTRMGLSPFEFLTRLAEAWRLKAAGQINFDDPWSLVNINDSQDCDDGVRYRWDPSFTTNKLVDSIEGRNDDLFDELRCAICAKLDITYRSTGYNGYLTRRIRREVHGPDLKSVMDKQITLPLVIPSVLENFLLNEFPRICPDLPSHYLSNPFLIPVHDPAKYVAPTVPNPVLPSLVEETSETGNLRYWVITNESMWTGQNPAMDEVSTVLWSLFRWFQDVNPVNTCDTPDAAWHLTRSLRRRALLPECASALGPRPIGRPRSKSKRNNTSILDAREALLFREWVLMIPHMTGRLVMDWRDFEEDGYMYPIPDELFWKEGDEGKWDGEEVPAWTAGPAEEDEGMGTKGKKRKIGEAGVEEEEEEAREGEGRGDE